MSLYCLNLLQISTIDMEKMNKIFKDLFPEVKIEFYTISDANVYTFRVYYDCIPNIDLKMIVTESNDENSHINVVFNKADDSKYEEKVYALNHMIEEIKKREQTELFSEIKEALIEDNIHIKNNFNIQIVIG